MTFMHKLSRRLALLKDRGPRGVVPASPHAPVAPAEQPLHFADSLETLARPVASSQTFPLQPNRAHTFTPTAFTAAPAGVGSRLAAVLRSRAPRGHHAGDAGAGWGGGRACGLRRGL